MLVYLLALTPRSRYVMELVFAETWGLSLEITTDPVVFAAFRGEKMAYGIDPGDTAFFIGACGLLQTGSLQIQEPSPFPFRETVAIFPLSDPRSALPFDVFAAIFYMVSRYEEYLPGPRDEHGRFSGSQSLAAGKGFQLIPVVNYWMKWLKEALLLRFPEIPIREPAFRAILTYDIDTAYAYRGRSVARALGSMTKDLASGDWKRLRQRVAVWLGKTRDPSDTYQDIVDSWGKVRAEKIFFILSGDYGPRDKNISIGHPLMKDLVKRLSEKGRIGIHPSYASEDRSKKILEEKQGLEEVLGNPVTLSRQHFLRYKLPDTYRALMDAGIGEEYSLGFADLPGFRAGTCQPFYFYDLEQEKKTALKVFPITFMEGTLKDAMKLDREQAWAVISGLLAEVRKAGGVFMSLWHNDSLTDAGNWAGWKSLHDRMILEIQSTR